MLLNLIVYEMLHSQTGIAATEWDTPRRTSTARIAALTGRRAGLRECEGRAGRRRRLHAAPHRGRQTRRRYGAGPAEILGPPRAPRTLRPRRCHGFVAWRCSCYYPGHGAATVLSRGGAAATAPCPHPPGEDPVHSDIRALVYRRRDVIRVGGT